MSPLRRIVREYGWIHTGLGLIGNTLFVIGSALFLREATHTAGVWMFLLGSSGMLLGSIGEALVRLEGEATGDGE